MASVRELSLSEEEKNGGFFSIDEAKGVPSESDVRIALAPRELNAWLTDIFLSVVDGREPEVKVETLADGIFRINLGDRQLMLMPAAHDIPESNSAFDQASADGLRPLQAVLAAIPRNYHLDNLTCVIPLAESNDRMHWTLLVLHNGVWHFFDPKGNDSRMLYSLDSIRNIIRLEITLPLFPERRGPLAFFSKQPEDTLHYINMQSMLNETHCGFFTAHIARHVFTWFINDGVNIAEMTRISEVGEEDARSRYFYDNYLKEIDRVQNLPLEAEQNRLAGLSRIIMGKTELSKAHKRLLGERIVGKYHAAINIRDHALLVEEEKNVEGDVGDLFQQVSDAIDAVCDHRFIEIKRHCKAVFGEMETLRAIRACTDDKLMQDCRVLKEIATLLQHPDADHFHDNLLQHANVLLQDDPSRSSGWQKLGYALLGVFGLGLMAAGVVAVSSGMGIGPGALLIKTGVSAITASVVGYACIGAGTIGTVYGQDRFFAKTSREQLQSEVAKIEAVPAMVAAH